MTRDQMWRRTPAGLFVRVGYTEEEWQRKSTHLGKLPELVDQVEALYAESGLSLKPGTGMSELLRITREIGLEWKDRSIGPADFQRIYPAVQFFRFADCILALSNVAVKSKYLRDLLNGSSNYFDGKESVAKNTLWELELWHTFGTRIHSSRLVDPPDIEIEFDGRKIGIACKKFYSEKHVQNVLSKGVRQVDGKCDLGIVAVNLDDLCSPKGLMRVATVEKMRQKISNFNDAFLARHDARFRRYLVGPRLGGVIVSTTAMVFLPNQKMNWAFVVKKTFWTIRGEARNESDEFRRLWEIIIGD